jgi:hypothetical protein
MQGAVFFVFLGRAWQHWFFEAPYREMLWDERRMNWIVNNIFGIDWNQWVTSEAYDKGITSFIDGVGGFYLVCAIAVFTIGKFPRISKVVLFLGALSLIFLAGLYYKQKLYATGQFFEYTLQFLSPIFLILLVKRKGLTKRLILILKLAVALTFFSHGLYAIGYYPISAGFIEMCINILPISESQAIIFLHLAGVFDFMVCILIFLPNRKAIFIGLAYCTIWGLTTAFARPVAYFYIEFWQESLNRWLFEAMYRFVHGLVPLVLFLFYWWSEKEKSLVPLEEKQDLIE